MTGPTAPRIYAIVAAKAPVAVVFRRGPSQWWHVGRWHLDTGAYEAGAWLHGGLYPRRCDISPDGELLCAFVRKRTRAGFIEAHDSQPDSYIVVSRTPWLQALVAWREGTTWGRGFHFVETAKRSDRTFANGEPDHGDGEQLLRRFGLHPYEVIQYAVERRRGWSEDGESPVRSQAEVWDESRKAVLTKVRPGGDGNLVLRDTGLHYGPPAIEHRAPTFTLNDGFGERALVDAGWADWAPNGLLLVATLDGTLQMRDPDSLELAVVHAHAISNCVPDPQPAPTWARDWPSLKK
jgi:hypothetical protein